MMSHLSKVLPPVIIKKHCNSLKKIAMRRATNKSSHPLLAVKTLLFLVAAATPFRRGRRYHLISKDCQWQAGSTNPFNCVDCYYALSRREKLFSLLINHTTIACCTRIEHKSAVLLNEGVGHTEPYSSLLVTCSPDTRVGRAFPNCSNWLH